MSIHNVPQGVMLTKPQAGFCFHIYYLFCFLNNPAGIIIRRSDCQLVVMVFSERKYCYLNNWILYY